MRKLGLVLALLTGLAVPTAAQAPPPVPALPDTSRLTSYALSASTCACAVGFALYGDMTDVDNWIEVFIGGTAYLSTDSVNGWALTSPTGSIGAIPRPITDALLTFTNPQTATVDIVGARRPRRLTQFSENRGVPARDLNQAVTDEIAMLRETWDKVDRAIVGQPGEAFPPLPPPASRLGGLLAFDGVLGLPIVTSPGSGTGNVIGPASSAVGDVACWNNITGSLLKDCGTVGSTTLTGPVTGGPAVGTVATTIAPTGVTATTYGSASQAPQITVNAAGQVTAASNQTITPAAIGAVPSTRNVFGGSGMTAGGALSADVTLGLATIPNNTILANNSGGPAAPGNLTTSQLLDMISAVQGTVLYRGASGWAALAPGTSGQLLSSGGAAANPSWATASGTGTVTSVVCGTGLSGGTITASGTCSVTAPVTVALGGTGNTSANAHSVPFNEGTSAQANSGAGSLGQCLASGGSGADPAFTSGCRVLLATLTPSNAATASDTTHITSTYNDYEIVIENLIPASASVTCELQVYSSGSYESTSYLANFNGALAGTGFNDTATTYVPCGHVTAQNAATPGISCTLKLYGAALTAGAKMINGLCSGQSSAPSIWSGVAAGFWTGGSAAIAGFQLLFSSGNITSGTIKIYGIL